jgi:hypothetical protein
MTTFTTQDREEVEKEPIPFAGWIQHSDDTVTPALIKTYENAIKECLTLAESCQILATDNWDRGYNSAAYEIAEKIKAIKKVDDKPITKCGDSYDSVCKPSICDCSGENR